MENLELEGEIWKDIEGFEGRYQVSNFGRVRGLARFEKHSRGGDRKVRGRMRKLSLDRKGYFHTSLAICSKYKNIRVHREVATAFIPNPDNLPEVNHKDFNPKNNKVENLEWTTHAGNMRYSRINGRFSQNFPKGVEHSRAKLTEAAVLHIRKREMSFGKYAKLYGVAHTTVVYACYGKNWAHLKASESA